jgi:hypothetical protein
MIKHAEQSAGHLAPFITESEEFISLEGVYVHDKLGNLFQTANENKPCSGLIRIR